MQIKSIVEELSEGDEIVFLTEPEISEAIINTFNAGITEDHPEAKLQQRSGMLVIKRANIAGWQREASGEKVARLLSSYLTIAENKVRADQEEREQNRRNQFARLESIFGVPALPLVDPEHDDDGGAAGGEIG